MEPIFKTQKKISRAPSKTQKDLLLFSVVIGEPHDDPKGGRSIGGGINVPVNLTFQTQRSQAKVIQSSEKGNSSDGKAN